jgi:hypothetical protein
LETSPDLDLRELSCCFVGIFPEHTDDRNLVEFIHLRVMKGGAIKEHKNWGGTMERGYLSRKVVSPESLVFSK